MAVASIKVPAARIQDAKTALAQAEGRARAILAREAKANAARHAKTRRLAGLGATGQSTAMKVYTGARGAVAGGTTGAAVGAAAASGASAIGLGAAAGSVVPIVGTAIGAIVGVLASGVLSSRPDPENANFDQAIQIYRTRGAQGIYNIADKYLVLAGLFDLQPHQIHGNNIWYKKYRRMGEHKFVTDMMNVIYNAEKAGKITASDTPQSIYYNIVVPWFNSWGMGQFSDPNGAMLQAVVIGMIAEYVAGMQSAWRDVNGRYTFHIPNFILPVPGSSAAAVASSAATAPKSAPTRSVPASVPAPPRTQINAQLPAYSSLTPQYLTLPQLSAPASASASAPAGTVGAMTTGSGVTFSALPLALLGLLGVGAVWFALRGKKAHG